MRVFQTIRLIDEPPSAVRTGELVIVFTLYAFDDSINIEQVKHLLQPDALL